MTTNDPRTVSNESTWPVLLLTVVIWEALSHNPLPLSLASLSMFGPKEESFINHFQLGCIFILLFYYWTDQGTLDLPAEVGIDISLKATEQRSVYSVQLYTLRLYSSSTFEFNWYANKMTGTATDTRKGKLRCGWCVLVNCWWSFVFNDH